MVYRVAVIVAALAVAVVADPLRFRRDDTIDIVGHLEAQAAGQAHSDHSETAHVTGYVAPSPGWSAGSGSGWGNPGWGSDASNPGWSAPGDIPAEATLTSVGQAVVSQDGAIGQLSDNDGQGHLTGIQTILVDNAAYGVHEVAAQLDGLSADLGSHSHSSGSGEGSLAAAGTMQVQTP